MEPTPTDPPPPPMFPPGLISNPSETRQANIIASAVITWVIGAMFVGLRFYARGRLLHNVIGVEDWLMVVALIFSGATSAGFIEQASYGLGKHFLDIDPTLLVPMSRAGWYSILWYMLSLLATKISICLLYLRVLRFRHARYAVWAILFTVVVSNGIWTLYTVLTACKPLSAFWLFDPTASCRPQIDWFVNTGLHIGTDVVMYILPLPVVVSLRVGLRQKLALYAVLALGLFVCLLSIVRLWSLTLQNERVDFPYDNTIISHLTVIEINAAIACACCMTLRPVMSKWFPKFLWSAGSGGQGGGNGDVEMGGAAGAGVGGEDSFRGPPTIGSTPFKMRAKAVRRDDLDNSQLLEEDDNEHLGGGGKDELRSIRTETDGASVTETGSGSGTPWTPREPNAVHTPERRDASHF